MVAAAGPAGAAPSSQARMQLDTALALTSFTAQFVPPQAGSSLAVRVDVGAREPRRLADALVILNACSDECRFLTTGGLGADGTIDLGTGAFPTDGSVDLKVKLRHGGQEHAALRLPRVAWRYPGDVRWGIASSPMGFPDLDLREVRINGADGPGRDTVIDARAVMRGSRTLRALLYAGAGLFATPSSRALRDEHRLSSGFAEHRVRGTLGMHGDDVLQVAAEVRNRTQPVHEGRPVLRATLPAPAAELTP